MSLRLCLPSDRRLTWPSAIASLQSTAMCVSHEYMKHHSLLLWSETLSISGRAHVAFISLRRDLLVVNPVVEIQWVLFFYSNGGLHSEPDSPWG